ncbi:hypothetical protein [Sorangium sp. So ce1151]|uniref:hypothetical protein n=1 Tax=Sorangium sp. So ce1151 TaxID=3133332 RepID=UPI003F5DC78D
MLGQLGAQTVVAFPLDGSLSKLCIVEAPRSQVTTAMVASRRSIDDAALDP